MRTLVVGGLVAVLCLLAGCSPPPEIADRPETPHTAEAASLLPPGPSRKVDFPGASDAAETGQQGRTHFTALRFMSEAATHEAFAKQRDTRLAQTGVTSSVAVDAASIHYVRYSAAGVNALVWISGTWLFIAEAGDAPGLAALIAASKAGGTGSTGTFESPIALAATFAIALVVLLALIFGLMKLVLRSIAVRPAFGVPPVSWPELARRLMALNAPDRPWTVRSGREADLVVEWKYADATWWGLLAKSGLRKAYRLRLYFDEASHRCGALDEFGEVDWSAGILAAPQVHFSKSFFRGVQLVRMERGVAYGFKTPTGGPGKVLDYSFDINDVKQPVVDAVTDAGWTYQPVIWPKRKRR